MRRRTLLELLVLGAASWRCGGGGDIAVDDWERKATALEDEQAQPFTAGEPGPWAGEEEAHIPTVTPSATVRVEVQHEQTVDDPQQDDHFVTALYVRDQDGSVIHYVELTGDEPAVLTSFTPPEGVTGVTAYAHCNVHGLWRSDTVAL